MRDIKPLVCPECGKEFYIFHIDWGYKVYNPRLMRYVKLCSYTCLRKYEAKITRLEKRHNIVTGRRR